MFSGLLVHAVVAQGSWSTLPDKALTCTGAEYKGNLGTKASAADCLTAVTDPGVTEANYGVWRGDSDKGCYICEITDRGDPSTWKYAAVSGAVSFVGTFLPTPPPAPTPAPAPAAVEVVVDAADANAATPFVHRWKRSFGSGHAALTLRDDWRAHMRQAADELGMQGVRYHGLFDDDMGPVVTRGADGGQLVYNWTLVDSTWDALLAQGVRPIVELSFMPAFIANCSWHGHCKENAPGCEGYWCTQCNGKGVLAPADYVNPSAPACHSLEFHYQGIKQTPPNNDYGAWGELVAATASHAIERYGAAEVRAWSFEVWNELWGMAFPQDYMALYGASVTALKGVDPQLVVGGPATAGLDKIPEFVAECANRSLPFDFVSSHHYPTDGQNGGGPTACPRSAAWDPGCFARQVRESRALVADHPFYLTEYNVGCCLGYESHDNAAAAAFIFRTVGDLNEDLDLYSYWTFTDIFEEGGLPLIEFKNIYGMMTIHGVPKPAWRAFQLLHEHAGDTRLPVAVGEQVTAHSNASYVDAFATTNVSSTGAASQRVFLSYWGNPDPAFATSDRNVTVVLRHAAGAAPAAQAALHVVSKAAGVDPRAEWEKMGSPAQPNATQLAALMAASKTRSLPVLVTPINATASSVDVLVAQDTAVVLAFA